MLHFGPQLSNHTPIWWSAVLYSSEQDWPAEIAQAQQQVPAPMVGQGRGGIGMFRTEAGQPQALKIGGAYALDTYVPAYLYASGSYSLGLQVVLSLSEAISAGEAGTFNVAYPVALSEALTADGIAAVVRTAGLTLTEALTLTDAAAPQAVVGVVLSESLLAADSIATNDILVAYVVNANTGAVSTYAGYNFNSLAKINGRFYAAGPEGIYELVGDDDAGTAIQASIALGTEEFGTDLMKRVPEAYLGVSTTGSLMLQVVAGGVTRTYTISPVTPGALHTGRLLIGKGIQSRYWDFELTNASGSDFILDSIAFNVTFMSRRIKE